ncbi:unnamed protein product [Symbiodinium sp. CCMP2592]|nr:unnamed protein product [Symbiodinium sp. CCMP2592]
MSFRRPAPFSSSASSSCSTLSSSTSATVLEYLDVLTDPCILFRVFLPLLELRLRTALVPPDSMMDTASDRTPAPDSTLRCLFPIAELHGQALAFRTERDYHLHYALAEITFHPRLVASLMVTCSRTYYAVRALLRDRGLQYAFYVERTPDLPRSHSSRPCLSIFHPFCPQQVRGMALHRGLQHWVFIPSSYQELPLIRLGRRGPSGTIAHTAVRLLPGLDDIAAAPRCPIHRNITATATVALRSDNIDIEILMLILPHDVGYTTLHHGHRLDDILFLPTLTDGHHTLTAGCTPPLHLMMIHPTILPPVHLQLDVNLERYEDIYSLGANWETTDLFLDANPDRGFPLPRNVVDTAFTRRLGIAEMPIHLVPIVSLTPNAGQAWIVRLLAAGRPLVIEIFRTRQEALLASFIIRTLRKSSDQYDISDVLKQNNYTTTIPLLPKAHATLPYGRIALSSCNTWRTRLLRRLMIYYPTEKVQPEDDLDFWNKFNDCSRTTTSSGCLPLAPAPRPYLIHLQNRTLHQMLPPDSGTPFPSSNDLIAALSSLPTPPNPPLPPM